MSTKRFKIYPASPMGFSEAGRYWYNGVFIPMLKEVGFDPLDPWELTPMSVIQPAIDAPYGEKKRELWQAANHIIGDNNVAAIRECDILVGILDGVDVDSGTASEIGAAAMIGKMVEGYRGDFRLSSDNVGSTVNLQVEKFIKMGSGIISTSLDTLRARLIERHAWLSAG